MLWRKQFGGRISANLRKKYEQSPHWQKDRFRNFVEPNMGFSPGDVISILRRTYRNREIRRPEHPLAVASFDRQKFLASDSDISYIWYGHSALLLRVAGKTLFIDPMLGPNASPIAPFPTKRFSKDTLDLIDELPEIDLILLTHDHYDHLDLASIRKLQKKTNQYFVALGVKRHLLSWDVDPDLITEFDWWQTEPFHEIDITFTPTRHFSGRGLTDRFKSLWGGWVLDSPAGKIWFSGDGGYGSHFREIGERLGPFDLAFMECDQYSEFWPEVHLFPEESVQAAADAGVQRIIPVHWGGFALAQHSWTDPAGRFREAAERLSLTAEFPLTGQVYNLQQNQADTWWEG